MKLSKPKKISITKLKRKADHLFAELIHLRGHCEAAWGDDKACGGGLQTAHVISRSNLTLRYCPDNALLMCTRHHLYWQHKSPLEFSEWFITNFPSQYQFLMREKNKLTTSINYEEIINKLQEQLAEAKKA
jgi:hypothetical protein